MTINEEVKNLLKDHNIDEAKGLLVLLAIYHNIPFDGYLESFFAQELSEINIIKIVDRSYPDENIIWNIPLFNDAELNLATEWSWVLDEYRPLFRNIDKSKGGTPISCVRRMKKFFAEHPEVRKQDVIEAAKMYIETVNDPRYLQQADYFIIKDTKSLNVTSRLEQFLEIIKENRASKVRDKMM
jgi:hypothetical protein